MTADPITPISPTLRREILTIVDERIKVAQVTREDFSTLKSIVSDLAAAQQRTEARVEELAVAQRRTEARVEALARLMTEGFQSLRDQIAALGSRWGIYNEGTFRATIRGILKKIEGIVVHEGHYGDRQVDVIIRNGEHILLEITSRMQTKDIERLYRSADDYHAKEGIMPALMVATSYISPNLMRRIMGLERQIEIFSYEGDE